VVEISVVDEEDAAGLQHLAKVAQRDAMRVDAVDGRQMGEGVAQADDCIKAPHSLHGLGERQPIGLLDCPVIEGGFLPPLPPRLQGAFEHLVGEVHGRKAKVLLQQHYGVDPGAASDVQHILALVVAELLHHEVPIMARPLGCVPDVEFPQLGSGTVGVLVLQTGGRDAEGTGTVHAVVRHCGCG